MALCIINTHFRPVRLLKEIGLTCQIRILVSWSYCYYVTLQQYFILTMQRIFEEYDKSHHTFVIWRKKKKFFPHVNLQQYMV